jgi:predicted Fe-Mo cluster-binding NifX family protein
MTSGKGRPTNLATRESNRDSKEGPFRQGPVFDEGTTSRGSASLGMISTGMRNEQKAASGKLPAMKIALPTRDDQSISGHFGKMKALIVIDVVDGRETGRERRDMSEMPACGNGHQDKPSYVVSRISDCDVLIAGGMGAHMRDTATAGNIDVVLTRERIIERALESYLDGTLANEPQLAHSPR